MLPSHSSSDQPDEPLPFSIQFHLLGTVPFEQIAALQQRLVFEAGGNNDGRITVLLCEHPALISVGRSGSRGHIRLTDQQLKERHLSVRWVGRGGSSVLHGPGQIAAYPIVPLRWHGWTVGEYLHRLRAALGATLDQLRVRHDGLNQPGGIWGRSGQLISMGIAVRNWVACYGAYINVNPVMTNYMFVDAVDPLAGDLKTKSTMGSLFAENRRAITVPKVRATLIPNLSAAFGTDRYHLTTGHPLLRTHERSPSAMRQRAS